jgi:cytochrome c2
VRRALLVAAVALLAGCGRGTHTSVVEGGDPAHGHDLIVRYGCGSCHTIGGVGGANGRVGPDLRGFDANRFLAGRLPNQPDNAVRWIMHPQQIQPRTLMPDLGVTRSEARDIAAYLYTQ